jgi:hypothetical protein
MPDERKKVTLPMLYKKGRRRAHHDDHRLRLSHCLFRGRGGH